MHCTNTYTNSTAIVNSHKVKSEAFHKRLKQLYPCVEDVTKLPHAWSPDSKAALLGLTYDNLGCYFRSIGRREDDEKLAAAVRADHYIPPSCLLYYFEITLISKGREGLMGVGLASAQVVLTKLPGWSRDSYAYHADDGNTFNGDGPGNIYGPVFTTGDVIGCGYNLVEGKCFFTKNGLNLGKAFEDIPSNIPLYPIVGLKTPGEEIKANFGQEEFVYDIDQDLRSLRKSMTLTITDYPISDFGNWQSTLHRLVQSWLIQNSYPNTADAFTRSAGLECKENMQRIQQRNQIQQLVLNGRISEAIELTNQLCPDLLQNNPNLLFALRCRQFIELISGAENDFQPTFDYANLENDNHANGTTKLGVNGDQPPAASADSSNHSTNSNGCNGIIGNNNINNNIICNPSSDNKLDDQQSTSSSFQELMDVDQPTIANVNDTNSYHRFPINTPSFNGRPVSNPSARLQCERAPNKLTDINGSYQIVRNDSEMDHDEQKFEKLILFGQELSSYLQQLDKIYGRNEFNERLLRETIGLIAFINPKGSNAGKLLEPGEREMISQLLNCSILQAEMGESYTIPLEGVMNHLRKLVRLNDAHGRWLIDRIY